MADATYERNMDSDIHGKLMETPNFAGGGGRSDTQRRKMTKPTHVKHKLIKIVVDLCGPTEGTLKR